MNAPVLQLISRGSRTGAYQTGVWNHIVFMRTASDSKLYLNGNLLITGTAGSNPAGNYFIGAWNVNTSQNFKGKVDELMIYNRILTTGEIQFLYASNLTRYDINRRMFTTNRTNYNSSFAYSGRAQDLAGGSSGTLTRTVTIDGVPPTLAFTGATPTNGALMAGSIFTGQIDITEPTLGQFIRNRNGS